MLYPKTHEERRVLYLILNFELHLLMFSQLFNWRTGLAMIAIAIVTGTIFYSNYLSKKIAREERRKVNIWAEALKTRSTTTDESALNLTNIITGENTDIPIIGTDENDNPIGEYLNLDTQLVKKDTGYLRKKVAEFKSLHECINVVISKDPLIYNKYYYGDSVLLTQVKYYPMIQLLIVAMFIIITLITISTRNTSTQNQVWAGMAKETAHQLGTPISSLEGWVEMMSEIKDNEKMASEMKKDVERLKLVSDRFGKIGSTPQLESTNIVMHVDDMVNYMRRRSSEKISFNIHNDAPSINTMLNPPLFDWVIENLLKNALDAMEGAGIIDIAVHEEPARIIIDVKDSGKGIAKKNITSVFKPGFSTKKRGWGLGLSLSKRIIEQYHQGEIFVKHSEPGKGTTFRIILKKMKTAD